MYTRMIRLTNAIALVLTYHTGHVQHIYWHLLQCTLNLVLPPDFPLKLGWGLQGYTYVFICFFTSFYSVFISSPVHFVKREGAVNEKLRKENVEPRETFSSNNYRGETIHEPHSF